MYNFQEHKIYFLDSRIYNDEKAYEYLLSIGNKICDRGKKNVNPEGIKQTILGEICTRYILSIEFGIKENVTISEGKYGKPILNSRSMHFNYSHSKHYIATTVSTYPVGIDIEYMEAFDYMDIVKHFFSFDEKMALMQKKGKARDQLFYKCWTCKESLAKCIGSGLNKMILHASPVFEDTKLRIYTIDSREYFVYTVLFEDNFSLSLTTEKRIDNIKKIKITQKDLNEYIDSLLR